MSTKRLGSSAKLNIREEKEEKEVVKMDIDLRALNKEAARIYETFIQFPHAPMEINIPSKIRKDLEKNLCIKYPVDETDNKLTLKMRRSLRSKSRVSKNTPEFICDMKDVDIALNVFDEANRAIIKLMASDSFPRYKKSKYYQVYTAGKVLSESYNSYEPMGDVIAMTQLSTARKTLGESQNRIDKSKSRKRSTKADRLGSSSRWTERDATPTRGENKSPAGSVVYGASYYGGMLGSATGSSPISDKNARLKRGRSEISSRTLVQYRKEMNFEDREGKENERIYANFNRLPAPLTPLDSNFESSGNSSDGSEGSPCASPLSAPSLKVNKSLPSFDLKGNKGNQVLDKSEVPILIDIKKGRSRSLKLRHKTSSASASPASTHKKFRSGSIKKHIPEK